MFLPILLHLFPHVNIFLGRKRDGSRAGAEDSESVLTPAFGQDRESVRLRMALLVFFSFSFCAIRRRTLSLSCPPAVASTGFLNLPPPPRSRPLSCSLAAPGVSGDWLVAFRLVLSPSTYRKTCLPAADAGIHSCALAAQVSLAIGL